MGEKFEGKMDAKMEASITLNRSQVWFNAALSGFHVTMNVEQAVDFADELLAAFDKRF